ncbi:putative Phytochrome interacting factor 3 [Hibiscus syriacus]|uniref:Phytochrome interacting factor 3 n=1 Tax=Hibiscus syriacus TaxID=106335 RepID=A0A6A2Y2V0_HIBSY|nr:putative Phytochrome interacting factor 3 [Hibiscus syriacus]
MSDCRSFGSNCHPSSQSRKVSMGIVLDSIAERKPGAVEEDKSKQTNEEKIKSSNGISVEGKNKREVVTSSKGKETEATEQNPDQTIKTPVTRSLARKRAPAKVQTDKTRVGLSSKQKHRQSSFSSREERSRKLPGSVNTGSKLHRKKKIEKKSSKIDPRKICFTVEDRSDEIKRTTFTRETPVPPRKSSISGNKMERFPGSSNEERRENFENVPEKHSFHSPVTNKKNQSVYCDNPTSLEKGDKQEDVCNISLRNVVCTPDNFQSPTFGFKAPILDTSPSPKPKTVEVEARRTLPSERIYHGKVRSFRTFQASRPVSNILNSQAHSPIYVTILQDSDMGVEHTKRYVHSESSSEERNQIPWILQSNGSMKISDLVNAFPPEPVEKDQEDELTRAVTLFASALKTFKRKMDSTTRNKFSEILVSISEEIKSLLSSAQSEIESDVGKLISLNKTKRKRLEIGLQGDRFDLTE